MAIVNGSVLTAADLATFIPVNLTTEDLDTVTTRGSFWQSSNVAATTARHYPLASCAGMLEILSSALGDRPIQRYTAHPGTGANATAMWTRGWDGSAWTSWRAIG